MTRRLVGIYAGTFDPVTNGHMDVIKRAMRVVDHLVVGVAINAGKGPMFSLEERVSMLQDDIAEIPRSDTTVEIKSFRGLLVDFAVACGASVVVRGLRAVSDFEYEFQLTGMNAHLNPDIETVFLMASSDNLFIASRLVKEIGALGGDITPFVSSRVRRRLMEKVAAEKAAE